MIAAPESISDERVLTTEFINKDDPIPDYRGNPLIGALGPIRSKEERFAEMYKPVPYDESMRQLSPEVLVHAIRRMASLFIPMPYHDDAMAESDVVLRGGLVHRNPLCPKYRRQVARDRQYLRLGTTPAERYSETPLLTQLITGCVGTGKTTISKIICSLYPRVIPHAYEVDGVTIAFIQVVYIRLVLMHDASLKAFAIEFFNELEAAVQDPRFKEKWRVDLCSQANAAILIYSAIMEYRIGMIIVDDSQNIEFHSGGAKKVLNYFVRLVNTTGVPVILVGTSSTREIISTDPTFARRFTCGTPEFLPLQPKAAGAADGLLEMLLEQVCGIQYTRGFFDWRPHAGLIYELTAGIPDLIVKLIILAQSRCFGRKEDAISDAVLKETAGQLFGVVANQIIKIKGKVTPGTRMEETWKRLEEAHRRLCNEEIARRAASIPFPEVGRATVELQELPKEVTGPKLPPNAAADSLVANGEPEDPRKALENMGAFRPLV